MSRKKRQQASFNAVDDSWSIVNDFRLRSTVIGFESYRTVDYHLYHKLEENEMIPLIEEHLDKLFAGEIDDGNGDMLDAIIFGAVREARPDLERQHYEHIDMLRRLVISRKADCKDIQRVRDERIKERDLVQDDYAQICHLLKQYEED